MTKDELIHTLAFQKMATPEKQQMLREINEGKWDLDAVPSPGPEAYHPEFRPPRHTGTPLEEFNRPFREAFTEPTWTEQNLPESFATRALSGLERGARAVAAPLVGLGNVLSQASEQVPRLIGQEPRASSVSEVAEQVPGVVAQALVPPSRGLPMPSLLRSERGGALASRVSEAEQLRRDAAAVGIPLTRAESTLRGATRRAEGVVEAAPFGAGRIDRYRELQRAKTAEAAEGVGQLLHPEDVSLARGGAPVQRISAQEVRKARQAEAERKATRATQAAETAEAPAREWAAGLGPEEESAQFVSGTQDRLWTADRAARAEGNAKYKAVEDLIGPSPVIALDKTAETASDIVRGEAGLGALAQRPTTGVARSLQNIAQETVEQYGLQEGKAVDLATARTLDSRIGGLIRDAKSDDVRRQLRQLQKSIRQDIDEYAVTVPGDPGRLLKEANEFWRTRVAEPFGEDSPIRGLLDTKEARKFDKVLFDPTGAERTAAIKDELQRVDPEAWRGVEARFGTRLMRDAINPTTGRFDPATFTRELNKYTPEALSAILGDKAEGVNRLRARFQATARGAEALDDPIRAQAVFREFAKQNPEKIVRSIMKRPADEIAAVKAMLRPEDWTGLTRAWWDEVIRHRSLDPNTKDFSRRRFLTQLNDIKPEQLRVLVGDETAEHIETIRRVMRQQEKIHPLGANPPGTANKLIATGQMVEAGAFLGSLLIGNVPGMTTAGALILTPMAVARWLTHPKGARLIAEASQAMPGTRAGMQAAQRLAILIAQQDRRQGQGTE
jgi:hypothetical protein